MTNKKALKTLKAFNRNHGRTAAEKAAQRELEIEFQKKDFEDIKRLIKLTTSV